MSVPLWYTRRDMTTTVIRSDPAGSEGVTSTVSRAWSSLSSSKCVSSPSLPSFLLLFCTGDDDDDNDIDGDNFLGVKAAASKALGMTETFSGFKEARRQVFSLLV